MNATEITWTTTYACPLEVGQTWYDHRGRKHEIAAVAPLRADGAVWAAFTAEGALLTRIPGVTR